MVSTAKSHVFHVHCVFRGQQLPLVDTVVHLVLEWKNPSYQSGLVHAVAEPRLMVRAAALPTHRVLAVIAMREHFARWDLLIA